MAAGSTAALAVPNLGMFGSGGRSIRITAERRTYRGPKVRSLPSTSTTPGSTLSHSEQRTGTPLKLLLCPASSVRRR